MATINYRTLSHIAYRMRIIATNIETAATKPDDAALFIAYCEMICAHEDLRDVVAGRAPRPHANADPSIRS